MTVTGRTDWSLISEGLPANTRVRAVEIDPVDPQHILVGVHGLGMYASTNGGASWDPSYAGLETNNALHDILFDPTDTQIVYAADIRSGVYRSTDGGQNWVKINDNLTNKAVTQLSISANGQHLYVGTSGEGVFRLDLNGAPPPEAHEVFLPLIRN